MIGDQTTIFDEEQQALNTLDPSENPNLVRKGNFSMTYNLQSDLNNFDKILLSNGLADQAIQQNLENLDPKHLAILTWCMGPDDLISTAGQVEQWLKVFAKIRDYLLAALWSLPIQEQALKILHNFLSADQLKFQIFEDIKDTYVKTLQTLWSDVCEQEECRQQFKNYLVSRVVNDAPEGDNSLKKFFKEVFLGFQTENEQAYA